MSTVVASTASMESEFQSLMVRGKKELCSGGDEAKLLTVGVALAGGVVEHTHVKDPVVHVRVWWTVETTKSPSMH